MSRPLGRGPAPAGGARRRLAILFADLSDSTRLAAAMEAEQFADLLGQLRDTYQAVVPRHGGTIVRVQGDGVLAMFGYPEAQEDDGRRATEAALDLHALVRYLRLDPAVAWPSPLSLHSGVHSGLVLLDDGDMVRGRFDLLGNATNIAARLCAAAGRDEILVSEETLGAESHFFVTQGLRRLRLKGVAAPVAVHRIVARAPIRTRFEARVQRGLVPFVGRAHELRMLEHVLLEVVGGKPRYLAVAAPAGLGKTRLVEEFLRRAAAHGCQVLRGYCESYLSAEPLQPFLQMLRALFVPDPAMPAAEQAAALERGLAEMDPDLLTWRTELLQVLSLAVAGAPGAARPPAPERTQAALAALFARLAAAQPLVLFVDDWQWVDAATRQVLPAILALDRPIFALIATRGFAAGDTDMTGVRLMELTPFTDTEAAETIGRMLPGIDPFLAGEIRRHAGGNPLFIEELCHSAAHGDPEQRLGRVLSGPAWLETLIEARVGSLPAEQGELVRAAAVIGNVIPAWLLERLTGYGSDHPLVTGLARQDLIFPGETAGTLRFKHGITREAIYAAVGLHQRREMHLRIAESLRARSASGAEQEVSETLAYHYSAAGQPAEAARFAELAGDKAMAVSALDRAQAQYRAALAAIELLPVTEETDQRWNAIAQRLGLACVFDPTREQLDVLRRAVDRARARDDQVAIAFAEYWAGYIAYALGDPRAAIPHLERALAAALHLGADPQAVQIRATLGQALASACDYDRALELLDGAIAVKRQHRTGARPAVGLCYSLTCKASVLGDRGRFAEAYACFDEALAAVRGAQHEIEGSLLCWRGGVHAWQGRWAEARQDGLEARRIGERVKSLYVFAMGSAVAAYAEWIVGPTAEALQHLIDATSWLEARNKGLFVSMNHGWLADALAASGRFTEARRHAARTLQRTRKLDRLGEPIACRAMARAAAAGLGRRPPQHYLDLAMRCARDRRSPHEVAVTQLCQAELMAATGEHAGALALIDEATAAFRAMDMTWHVAQADRVRAVSRAAARSS